MGSAATLCAGDTTDSDDSDPPMNVLDTVIDIISDFSRPEALQAEDGWVDMTDVVYMAERQDVCSAMVDEAIENWESMGCCIEPLMGPGRS